MFPATGNARITQRPEVSVNQQKPSTASVNFSTRLFKDRDDLTSVIVVVPSGSMVEIIDTADTFLHVRYEGTEGYIMMRHASPVAIPVASPSIPAVDEADDTASEPQGITGSYTRLAYLTDKYGDSTGKKIYERKLWKGMTGEMIIDSWGNPLKISRIISGNNVREEWSYNRTWLFLSNDRLTEWGPAKE